MHVLHSQIIATFHVKFSSFFRRLIEPIQSGITMDIEWTKPVETYGELIGYSVKYGKRGGPLDEIRITDKDVQHQKIHNLEKGIGNDIFTNFFAHCVEITVYYHEFFTKIS